MILLAIESSCDDTSVALLDCSDKGHFVIAEKTASQIEIHKKYGGVVPEVAGRMHAEAIVPLIEEVLKTATATPPRPLLERGGKSVSPSAREGVKGEWEPDAIAVTAGPGLITGLLVGVEAAKVLSWTKNIPLVAVNHVEGHIHSVEIAKQDLTPPSPSKGEGNDLTPPYEGGARGGLAFPALALVVSGGHTELILMKDHGEYEILGKTKDDAAGECFDKIAKLLDLPYPGGPQISKFAEAGNTKAINFPRPMLDRDNYDFSFAGLKTSALYWLRDNELAATNVDSIFGKMPAGMTSKQPEPITINDFCASVEQAIVDVLVTKTLRAAKQHQPKTILLAGGVAANKKLRETLTAEVKDKFPISNFQFPPLRYCMDNAAMIAVAGYYKAKKGQFVDWREIIVDPNWKIA